MIALVNDNLDAIAALCREYGVLRLELFGSAATGEFDPEHSDIDFIVEYPDDYDFGLWLTRYFEFRKRLEDVLGFPVDLVMVGAIRDPYFIESVNESRSQLYAA
jgi:predicted nucleotidyltransferase